MRISKKDANELAAWRERLRVERERISTEFERVCIALGSATLDINAMIDRHNESLASSAKFVERVAGDLRDAYGEKSDKWMESDAGQAADAMICEWESVDLREVDQVVVLVPDPPFFKESLSSLEVESEP